MSTTRRFGLAVAVVVGAAISGDAQSAAPPSGIFLEQTNGESKPLPQQTSMEVQTSGIWKTALTQGFSKPKQIVTHTGATSELVITEAQPSFIFRFADTRAPIDPMSFMTAGGGMQGLPYGSKHPKEFSLILLTVEGENRIFDSTKIVKVKLDIQDLKNREFRVRPHEPLIAGEHAFMFGDARKGAVASIIWSFSCRPAGLD